MIYTIGFIVLATLGAGLYFKREETVALLKNAFVWAGLVAGAVATYFDFDISKITNLFN